MLPSIVQLDDSEMINLMIGTKKIQIKDFDDILSFSNCDLYSAIFMSFFNFYIKGKS